MLSTSTESAADASASSSSANVCTSTSIGRPRQPLAHEGNGGAHTARQADVIVLDQHGIEQPDAMIGRAAGTNGVFLQGPQRRRGLARVEDDDATTGRVDKRSSASRDAGQTLQEIERGALAREQRGRRPDDSSDHIAWHAPIPVMSGEGHLHVVLELTKGVDGDVQAGDDAVAFHKEDAAGALTRPHGRGGGDIAGADVLVERPPDDVAVLGGIEGRQQRGTAKAQEHTARSEHVAFRIQMQPRKHENTKTNPFSSAIVTSCFRGSILHMTKSATAC